MKMATWVDSGTPRGIRPICPLRKICSSAKIDGSSWRAVTSFSRRRASSSLPGTPTGGVRSGKCRSICTRTDTSPRSRRRKSVTGRGSSAQRVGERLSAGVSSFTTSAGGPSLVTERPTPGSRATKSDATPTSSLPRRVGSSHQVRRRSSPPPICTRRQKIHKLTLSWVSSCTLEDTSRQLTPRYASLFGNSMNLGYQGGRGEPEVRGLPRASGQCKDRVVRAPHACRRREDVSRCDLGADDQIES